MTEQTAPVPAEYLAANPDLSGGSGRRRCRSTTPASRRSPRRAWSSSPTATCSTPAGAVRRRQNGLWFNDRWPAARFFAAWQDMAARYASNPLVAAMDIMNEPRRTRVGWRVLTPTWGSRSRTDIAAMYTAAGNLIHEVSPDVLIICEGLELRRRPDRRGQAPGAARAPGQGRLQPARLPLVPPGRPAPGRRTSSRWNERAGTCSPSSSPRCGSASSAAPPGPWPPSPACGGTTSRPG